MVAATASSPTARAIRLHFASAKLSPMMKANTKLPSPTSTAKTRPRLRSLSQVGRESSVLGHCSDVYTTGDMIIRF